MRKKETEKENQKNLDLKEIFKFFIKLIILWDGLRVLFECKGVHRVKECFYDINQKPSIEITFQIQNNCVFLKFILIDEFVKIIKFYLLYYRFYNLLWKIFLVNLKNWNSVPNYPSGVFIIAVQKLQINNINSISGLYSY